MKRQVNHIRRLFAVLRREWWVNTRAYRVSFFAATFMTSLFTLAIGYFLYHAVFGGRVSSGFQVRAGTGDYMSYLTLGVLVYNFADRMLYPVRNYLEEHWQGTIPTLLLAGLPHLTYQLGCVLFSALYSLLEQAVLLTAAWLWVGLDLSRVRLDSALLGAAASFFGLYSLSLVLSALCLYVRDRVMVEGVAFSLIQLVCGVLFPVSYLPAALQWLSRLVPVTWALQVLRGAGRSGLPPQALRPDLAALVTLGLVYIALGRWLLQRALQRVVEEVA